MIDEFVTYEQAKTLIDDLGFRFYDDSCYMKCYGEAWDISLSHEVNYPMPLKQQAFRWFRKKHNLFGQVNIRTYFIHDISNDDIKMVKKYDKLLATYEEAELACLKQLIKILKNK